MLWPVTVFGSGSRPPLPLTSLPPPSLLSACATSTDGNKFFQLLAEVGEACSCPVTAGLFLALLILFWQQRAFHPYSPSPPAFHIPHLPLWCSLAFSNPVFRCLLLICCPISFVPVLPCDGNVLVNCIPNLRVCVCLGDWFMIFC